MSANGFDKFYVGLNLMGLEDNGIQRPISRVTLLLDDENVLTAGDDTGLEITADCPHATQAMVNSILAELKGSRYKMYSSTDAKFDPAAELGDGITVGDIYSCISRIDDGGMGFPSPSAPGKEELEDEYPAGGPMTQFFNRKIGEVRSSITKTAEEIRLQVDDLAGRISSISTRIDSITLSVVNGSTSSTIKLLAGGIEISSQDISMSGVVTYTGLLDGTTVINGGCIQTGTIDSISITSSEITGSSVTGASITGGEITGTTITGTEIDGNTITGGTISGSTIEGVIMNGSEINGALIDGGRFVSSYTQHWENELYPPYTESVLILNGVIEFSTNDQLGGKIYTETNPVLGTTEGLRFDTHGEFTFFVTRAEGSIMPIRASAERVIFGKNLNELVHCNNNLDMHNYSVLNTSDARFKKNIQNSDMDALSVINFIKTYSFDWKENGNHEKIGFIAQQLEKVNPDFVNIDQADGHYSTKDMKIIPYLVKAVQELFAKIEKLEGESQ